MVYICVGLFSANTFIALQRLHNSRSASAHITGACVAPSTCEAVRVFPSRPLCGLISKLLLMQKTKLPRPSTVCSGKPDTMLA